MKVFASKRTELKVYNFVTGPEKYIVCRRMCALFNPEILQPWIAKGLIGLIAFPVVSFPVVLEFQLS